MEYSNKAKQISSILLFFIGFIIVIDTMLVQFGIGTKQNNLIIGYCVAFILLSIKFPTILKNKYVIIPLYLMILQMIYSLVRTYIFI